MSDQHSPPRPWLPIAVKAAILHAVMTGVWLVVAGPAAGTLTIGHGLLLLAGSGAIFAYLACALRRKRSTPETPPAAGETGGQMDAGRERDRQLATACHNMRTPLTAIIGFIELLQDDRSLSNPTRQKIEIIGRESVKLQTLFDKFLAARHTSPPSADSSPAAPEPSTARRPETGDERAVR